MSDYEPIGERSATGDRGLDTDTAFLSMHALVHGLKMLCTTIRRMAAQGGFGRLRVSTVSNPPIDPLQTRNPPPAQMPLEEDGG